MSVKVRSDLINDVYLLVNLINALVIFSTILLMLFVFRLCAIIASWIIKYRKAKLKEHERLVEKMYKSSRKLKKEGLFAGKKNETSEMQVSKEPTASKLSNVATVTPNSKLRASTLSNNGKNNNGSERTSALHQPGTPLSKKVSRTNHLGNDDDLIDEVVHVSFDNTPDRPPRNSASNYRFVEAKWVESEDPKNLYDYHQNSKEHHESKMAASSSFGTSLPSTLSTFSESDVSKITLKSASVEPTTSKKTTTLDLQEHNKPTGTMPNLTDSEANEKKTDRQ